MNDHDALLRAAEIVSAQIPATQWTPECRKAALSGDRQERALTVGGDTSGVANFTQYARWVSANVEVYSTFAKTALRVPMQGMTFSFPRQSASLTANVVAEATTITPADMTLEQEVMVADKYAVATLVSNEWLEDAVLADPVGFLAQQHMLAIARAIESAGWSMMSTDLEAAGNFLNSQTGNTTAVTTDLDDVLRGIAALPNYATDRAIFCSPTVYGVCLQKLAAQAGGSSIVNMENGFRPMFAGLPVYTTTSLPDGDSPDEVFMVVADMSKAAILGDRKDASFRLYDETYANADQSLAQTTARYAFAVNDNNAAVLLKTATA